MRPSRRLALSLGAVAFAALAAPSASLAAEQLAGVTNDNRLVFFRSDSPGNLQYSVPINGLGAGERIVGLDVRPANDRIYGLGSSNRIYALNGTTGAATPVGDPFTPALNGSSFGFDFNPAVDRIRVTSDTEQDLRINPDTGVTAATDTPLQYAAGDPGAGSNPTVGGSAYTPTAFGGATTLYDIDTARDALVTQNPPNSGTLNTVGALGVDASEPVGFDIAPNGTAYAALRSGTSPAPSLYTINLTSGAAAPVRGNATLSAIPARGNDGVVGIAALGQVSDDRSAPGISVAFSSTQLRSRLINGGIQFTVSCDEACSVNASSAISGLSSGSTTGVVSERAGRAVLKIALDDAAKARLRRPGLARITLRVDVIDAAGNAVSTTRVSRER